MDEDGPDGDLGRHDRSLPMIRAINVVVLSGILLVSAATVQALTEEAVCSDPNVLFCDNFNDRALTNDIRSSGNFNQNLGGKTTGWQYDQSPGQKIVSTG